MLKFYIHVKIYMALVFETVQMLIAVLNVPSLSQHFLCQVNLSHYHDYS